MPEHSSTSYRPIASCRLTKAITLLYPPGEQLEEVSRKTPDYFNANLLRQVATRLRDLSIPPSRTVSRLDESGAL